MQRTPQWCREEGLTYFPLWGLLPESVLRGFLAALHSAGSWLGYRMNTTLAGNVGTSHLQAQLSALQYLAPHVIQPDNSDSEHGLPQVGQNVAFGLNRFGPFNGFPFFNSGMLAEGEGFEPSTLCIF